VDILRKKVDHLDNFFKREKDLKAKIDKGEINIIKKSVDKTAKKFMDFEENKVKNQDYDFKLEKDFGKDFSTMFKESLLRNPDTQGKPI